MENLIPYATLAIFIFNLILTVSAAKIHNMIKENIDALKKDIDIRVNDLSSKLIQFEIWSRDNFVRKDSFMMVKEELIKDIDDMGNRLENRLERMEIKMDTKIISKIENHR